MFHFQCSFLFYFLILSKYSLIFFSYPFSHYLHCFVIMIICAFFPSFPTFFRSLFPSVCAMMNIVSISGGFFYYEYCFS